MERKLKEIDQTKKEVRIPIKRGYTRLLGYFDLGKPGVKALYARFPNRKNAIATLIFLKEEGWTLEKALEWIKKWNLGPKIRKKRII